MSTDHPATFSDDALLAMYEAIRRYKKGKIRLFDPFAGVGTIHKLSDINQDVSTLGIELEPEWADQHERTIVGDALDVPTPLGLFDVVATSVCYGNRMADHHEARDDSKRHTYRHYLGRMPTEGSAAVMQWGAEYRAFHIEWLRQVYIRLRLRGLLVVDIKDHYRAGKLQGVVEWWAGAAVLNGFDFLEDVTYAAPGQRHGANGAARVDEAHLLVFQVRTEGEYADGPPLPPLVPPPIDGHPLVAWPWGLPLGLQHADARTPWFNSPVA